jgi:hypothetical protein
MCQLQQHGTIVGEISWARIEARGVGGGVIAKLDKCIRGSALDAQTEQEFVRAVSEWADRDAFAVHIAYGFATSSIRPSKERRSPLHSLLG